MQTPAIEFLQQFREETIALPKDQRKLNLRPFSRLRKEKQALDRLLAERFTQSSLIRSLVAKIEQKDQAITSRIADHIKKMLSSFSAFVRMDPSSAQYFIRLSKETRQLLDWTGSYQDQTQAPLLNRLKCIASQKPCHREIKFFCSRDIDNTETAIQLFYDGLCQYYELFCHYFEHESEASGRTLVVSETGRLLYGLLTLIGRQIGSIENTITTLQTWQTQSRNIEIQEIYN